MKRFERPDSFPAVLIFAWLAIGGHLLRAQSDPPPAGPPLPADHKVDFHREILPILARRCGQCHTGTNAKGGLSMNTRASLIAGGDSGSAVIVGRSTESLLVERISDSDADSRMPAKGQPLDAREIALMRAWIDQGLPWEEGLSLARSNQQKSLALAPPQLPPLTPGAGSIHPIDRLLEAYWEQQNFVPEELVDDRTFSRRVSLDLVGLLPAPELVVSFCSDTVPDKRARLVRRLLDDQLAYAAHWLAFWNDLLRNEYRGTGFIDGGRRQITVWLFAALYDNKPYDQFVRELIDPAEGADGFLHGIQWRGAVSASQRREMQAAQTISQVFMGTNLKCASCHDSFVNDWKLTDAYALATVFADEPLEIHRCDKPLGQFAEPGFIYPALGEIDPKAPRVDRQKQLAAIITSQDNGRLARTMVNRLWGRLFGFGLVATVDDMDQKAIDPGLLDWLSADFQQSGYDMKHVLELLCTSRAYQLRAVGTPLPEEHTMALRGPLVRRMSAEQFIDAVSTVTGSWRQETEGMQKRDDRGQGGQLADVLAVLRVRQTNASSGEVRLDHLRAALADADPLLRSLGRPTREQVATQRDTIATTLQAIELVNGRTLDDMLKQGAQQWIQKGSMSGDELVVQLYTTALGRPPKEEELAQAVALVGSPATPDGVQDLLWALVMLPEFQLIY